MTKIDNPILITGATGRHGNTGEYLVRRLREEGRAVRVLARTPSERTERLAELGAEIAIGDLHDRRTLVPALADVDLAYFTYPIDAGVIPAAANYAAAVREVGRQPRTVVMSMGPSHPENRSDLGRAQWLAEEVMQWAGLDLLILRVAALFHENLKVLHSRSIREHGLIRNSFGPQRVAWISGRDAAELALAGLLHPQRFSETIVYIKGSEEHSHVEIAELLSELSGSPVRYETATQEQWRDDLLDLSRADGEDVVNPAMAQHISAVGHMVAHMGRTLPADRAVLRELIGREPLPLRAFLESHLDRWSPVNV
ncbi:NmrA family NAD(P)-binding protein [Mycolicibacterium goodii]|uniref:NmrA family NAD(P)-binding protein n=1 Tax=Mycolicibacterium goodii TaxID=134601 RepID=UPI000C26A295|nr:NmrA family NAD(P)-binding protein [Mycolicibacterium goodii]PJK20185.1 NmrA family transcriptional regulator [Mycolicibacterium goodii]